MKQYHKYKKQYFMPPHSTLQWAEQDSLTKPPIWCSVDLRDGNQALVVPMSLEEKLCFFQELVRIGFKEIEVGFPAASQTEFAFVRALIERQLIPDDVTIQVLTQAREHIVARTFEALDGVNQAIVHVYNSTSYPQREQVFRKTQQQVKEIAITGATLVQQYAKTTAGNFRFEYSPESFTATEIEYALEVCNSVLDVWRPKPDAPAIINLPATVSHSMSHVYANQVAYLCDHLDYHSAVQVSLHPHNDRGCAVADAEMGLLAGADRVEGTLFGNGERTGNVDLVTLALNLYAQGVDPGLDFSDLPHLVKTYETFTHMNVYERQPYSGGLVFAAFSGSHQDAIAKGMRFREEQDCPHWTVPYLPIDPKDVGREYEADVIRVNSQSGKGGIGYLLKQHYGYDLPPKMQEQFGYVVKNVSDEAHRELSKSDIHTIFKQQYLNLDHPFRISQLHFQQQQGQFYTTLDLTTEGHTQTLAGVGNGRLDAVCHALNKAIPRQVQVVSYQEHALEQGSGAKAVAYLEIAYAANAAQTSETIWGVGVCADIVEASVLALLSAVNRAMINESEAVC